MVTHNEKVTKLVRSALMAAVCLVLTKVVTIPVPTGYVNLGDCAVLLSAWLLGPVYGGMAAGLGTALADVLSGYAAYAPATFVIKFFMAFTASHLFRLLGRRPAAAHFVAAAVAECMMVAGYFAYESAVLGVGMAAVASVPANLVQGAAGIVTGVVLIQAVKKAGFPMEN